MMDWNWFYSSVAQSAAAVVAFFGGFVAAKIISNQGDYGRLVREIQHCILECRRLSQRAAASKMEMLVSYQQEIALNKVKELINQDGGARSSAEYFLSAPFLDFDSHEAALTEINRLIEQKQGNPAQNLQIVGRVIHNQAAAAEYQSAIRRGQDEVNEIISTINHRAGLTRALFAEATADPFSSALLGFSMVIILALFIIGVIFPLSLLPTDGHPIIQMNAFLAALSTLKGWLLLIVSVLLIVVLLTLLLVNARLKVDPSLISLLRQFTDEKAYAAWLRTEAATRAFRVATTDALKQDQGSIKQQANT